MHKKLRWHHTGFTLLELLVVLAIASIISYYIVIHDTGRRPFQEMQRFSEQLQSLIQIAQEQSNSNMTIIGLRIDQHHYAFYQRNEDTSSAWVPLRTRDSFWKRYSIPASLKLQVSLFDSGKERNELAPQIFFFPDGRFSAFVITLRSQGTQRVLQIIGKAPGPVLIRELP